MSKPLRLLIPTPKAKTATVSVMMQDNREMTGGSGVVALQLLLVRSLIDRAQFAARETFAVSSMSAILLADTAVESVTKAACFAMRLQFNEQGPIGQMIEALHRQLPDLDPTVLRDAERNRRNRNLVQHQGHIPDVQMVAASVRDAERYCALIVQRVFNQDFAALSSVQLVRHRQLRMLLDASRAALDSGDTSHALLCALGAFDFLHYTWARALRLVNGHDESNDGFRSGPMSVFLRSLGVHLFVAHPGNGWVSVETA